MADKSATDPSSTSLAYDAMVPHWQKVRTVLAGTDAMRAAGHAYLPQHPAESDEAYTERLGRCTLLNLTDLTLGSWVGRPFSKNMKFEVPEPVQLLLPNVDLLGNSAHVFLRNWFREGLAKGYSHVYVDYPRVLVPEDGVRTLAQDREENLRPYWIHYEPEQVFFADMEVKDGKEQLREVRVMEQLCERNGFVEVVKEQIRRIFMADGVVNVELYQVARVSGDRKEWVVVDSYTISLPFIPMVTFYSSRSGFMLSKPPLEDLADLNIAHWQSTSDQRAVLTVARFPILAGSGVGDTAKLVVGPNRWLSTPDPQGRFYYVEHTGAAIEAGSKDLASLEAQMAEYGAEFLKKRPGSQTATARILDTAEATSPLQDVTMRFQASVNEVLRITGQWLKLTDSGSCALDTDFGEEGVSQPELTTLTAARTARDISRVAFLKELQRREVLSQEYDAQADAQQLQQELMDL